MLNKIVGYSAFRTYGELPYSTSKQGKELQQNNKIWESTIREVDHQKPLENFHNSKTIYKKSFLENTYPKNYHPQHVPKGGNRTIEFPQTGSIKSYDQEETRRCETKPDENNVDERKSKLLKTGTEHWKTNYQQFNDRSNSECKKYPSSNQCNQSQSLSQISNNLVDGKTSSQLAEQSRAKSYKNRPYTNCSPTGMTDYKFNFGGKIGSSPMEIMNKVSVRQPLRDNPLKKGTNQLWTQIPNYQGFKPSELAFKEYEKKIDERKIISKENLKLQTTENFLVNVPGYGGYKPQFESQTNKLRINCLSTD